MPKQLTLEAAFKLLDKYNETQSLTVQERIATQLFNAGYIIRPAQVMILKDEVNFEHINPGSNEWTLHSRATRLPVERPKEEHIEN